MTKPKTTELDKVTRAKIHTAMEACGTVHAAAKELGVNPASLSSTIQSDSELNARWGSSKPEDMSSTETLSRPPAVIDDQELSVAEAMDREDSLLRKGLTNIGLAGDSLEMALALQKFQSAHFSRSIEMIGGGITKQFFDLMTEYRSITNEINELDKSKDNLEREKMLRMDRAMIVEAMGRTYDRASNAAKTQAAIKRMMKDAASNPKQEKPRGFLAINAQPGSKIDVRIPPEAKSE